MTSQINPNNIDGAYPVAGQDNNSQGFRDNFTSTKVNFQYAKDEIDDLDAKVLLKAALTGQTLDNNMNDQLIYAALIQDFSLVRAQIAQTSGSITVNYVSGHYQTVTIANTIGANISLAFTNFPAAGSYGILRLQVTVQADTNSDITATLTLPSAVSLGINNLQGYDPVTHTISYSQAGVYVYDFTTVNGGSTITIFDLSRNKDPMYLPSSQDLPASGAVSLTTTASYFTTAGSETATLAAGVAGQIKTLMATDVTAGNMVITVTNAGWKASGTGTITFNARGEGCTLQYINSKWYCIGNNGAVFA